MKVCFKCGVEKELDDFYKHKLMADGRLNKCKSCAKVDVSENYALKVNDQAFIESERKRGREKYHRLYVGRPINKDVKTKAIRNYKNANPEKYKARNVTQKMERPDGVELHHWSYNEDHYRDVISLTVKDHAKAHRFLKYDKDHFMYRSKINNELLDTRVKHSDFIRYCIEFLD